MRSVKTRWPLPKDQTETAIKNLCDLVNGIYDKAELGLWKVADSRTNVEEIRKLLKERKLILAEKDGHVIGCIQVLKRSEAVMEFGMLAVDDSFRGAGIGLALIKAAEDYGRKKGCNTMLLEILTPRGWKHPGKERLKDWYVQSGYNPQDVQPFEQAHPEKATMLATECDFTVWTKPLIKARGRQAGMGE